jgi:two-component system, NarL family, nitrate/nitrite sensor histidine kinase NarX
MHRLIAHSLLLRVGLVMTVLTLLSTSSMMTSVFIGRTIQGGATAVNVAGSLRMQSYRIATQLLTADEFDERLHWQRMQGLTQTFEGRLYGSSLTAVLPDAPDHEVRHAYENVRRQWEQRIRPILDAYVSGIIPPNEAKPALAPRTWGMISDTSVASLRTRYLSSVATFVDHIDQFVKVLERNTEAKISWLRFYEWIALFVTVGIVLIALVFVNRKVVTPMRHLLSAAEATGNGDFSVRTPHTGSDELGRLGSAFNEMAEALSKQYQSLEERVRIKTKDLERSNRSLEVLYTTVNRLSASPSPHNAYQELLEEITALVGTGPAAICLNGSAKAKAHLLASTGAAEGSLTTCNSALCHQCLGEGQTHYIDRFADCHKNGVAISIPIKDAQQHHGILLVAALDENGFAGWQKRVLGAVASHIGIAITMSGLHAERNRLALFEERNAIARELHDSLAQSLSYAKIQISRLDSVLGKGNENSEAQLVSQELRDGLNRAYRELRELLTTFRLTMDDHNLSRSIRHTVEEFNQRGEVEIAFAGDYPNGLLEPNEEVNILQIVREALSNILQHSHASRASISLRRNRTGKIELKIEDDGIGMDIGRPDAQRHHYGLIIMRERARSLGGELAIASEGKGMCVALSFIPAVQRKETDAKASAGQVLEAVRP